MKIAIGMILITVLFTQTVLADSTSFNTETSANITYDNKTVRLLSEGIDVTYNITTSSQTAKHQMNISRRVSFSCNIDEIENLLKSTEDTVERLEKKEGYFDSYLSCFGNLTKTSTQLNTCKDKKSFETEYDTCTAELDKIKTERDSMTILLNQCNIDKQKLGSDMNLTTNTIIQLNEDNINISNQRIFVFLPIGFVIGFALAWYAYYYSKREINPKEQMLR